MSGVIRKPQSPVITAANHLAVMADTFQNFVNTECLAQFLKEGKCDEYSDYFKGLKRAIYEYRKKRDATPT